MISITALSISLFCLYKIEMREEQIISIERQKANKREELAMKRIRDKLIVDGQLNIEGGLQ